MEKMISPEERIRRAEEIYYRRRLNNRNVRMSSSQVTQKSEKRQFAFYKKMALQILICILIYLIFSLIKDANYLFSEDIINRTKEFLSTDINFSTIAKQVEDFWKNNQDKFTFFTGEEENKNQEEQNMQEINTENQVFNNQEVQNETNQNNEEKNEQTQNQAQTNQTTNSQTGIGGGSSNETIETSSRSGGTKTQMQIDAEYIKKNFSLQLPAKAKITSAYGKRTPTEIVSENHQGIDIGVSVGTTVVSAMEGTVSLVSDEGSYGTHVKIENKDVTTIYAHCSKILVKEGQKVKKGQKIALSGNTGNTTGPHLHFEIRRSGRCVNPELVLKWG